MLKLYSLIKPEKIKRSDVIRDNVVGWYLIAGGRLHPDFFCNDGDE